MRLNANAAKISIQE